MAKRSIEIEREYRQYTKMSPEFVHLTGESLKQQIGALENKVEKVSAKIENLSAEIEELKKSDKEEDKKALEAKSAQKESLSKVLEAAKKERDEQKPKLEKQLNRVQGFEKNKEQIARIKQIKSDLRSQKLHLEWKIRHNEKLISELEDKLNEIDEDVNIKLVIAELEKMEKTDVKEFYAEDFTRLDELRDEKAKIDKEKAGINSQITSLKNTNKDLGHRIDTLNTEIAKCDLAWKNLFANKTWDEIEAKSMDGRFTKKEEKAKQEEPAKEEKKEEKAPATEEPVKEEAKKEEPNLKEMPIFEKFSFAKKPEAEKTSETEEPMWTDIQSEEEAKKEEAETALTKTSRWSKLWNAIKHPIQTIKAARAGKAEKIAKEASEKGEGPIVPPLKIEDLQGNEKTPTAEKTEAQSVDAFITKLRQMTEKEAVKNAQNKDNKEQPDYSKYVTRHARKVEAQKQRDDEGR
mgnify:FL=1